MTGLYLHVPFCRGKCPYCDFFSLRGTEEQYEAYTECLLEQMREWKGREPGLFADTLYFGGGTPSLLGAPRLGRLTEEARRLFGLVNAEITVEVNPENIPAGFFETLCEAGVNRVSLGLQSANAQELRLLGRAHTPRDVAGAADAARRAGITNLSFDLMLALPGQTDASLGESVRFCAENGARHVSSYLLQVEPGTAFYRDRDRLSLPEEDEACARYLLACEALERAGYPQYEVSNYAHPGFESRHNLKYWNGEDYLGLGPSAHSYYKGGRFSWPRSLRGFLNGEPPAAEAETEISTGSFAEYAMLRLRLTAGLTEEGCLARFRHGIPPRLRERANRFEAAGLLSCTPEAVRLTKRGFLVSNALLGELLDSL